MAEAWPTKVIDVVIGIDDAFNFMNYVDPHKPVRLRLEVHERCVLRFTLSERLLTAGWQFQDEPIVIRKDYGVNFSSYMWVENEFQGEAAFNSRFEVVFECARYGEYEYSLLMLDRHRQKISLDPKIQNGTGLPAAA